LIAPSRGGKDADHKSGGPRYPLLKIKGSWKSAMKKSLKKKKPPEGWPK